MKAEVGNIWYRVEDYYDGDGQLKPYERVLYVVKVTPAGVRLAHTPNPWAWDQPRFVLYPEQPLGRALENIDNGGKRYAYPTLRMARWSWLHRKERQLRITRAKVADLESVLAARVEQGESFWDNSPSRKYVFDLTGA